MPYPTTMEIHKSPFTWINHDTSTDNPFRGVPNYTKCLFPIRHFRVLDQGSQSMPVLSQGNKTENRIGQRKPLLNIGTQGFTPPVRKRLIQLCTAFRWCSGLYDNTKYIFFLTHPPNVRQKRIQRGLVVFVRQINGGTPNREVNSIHDIPCKDRNAQQVEQNKKQEEH